MRKFPDLIEAYLDFTKELESPHSFHLGTAIFMIGAALKRRVFIDQIKFEYTPNQFMVLVAPPGVIAKSTTIGVAEKLLYEVPGMKFGSDSTTWQAFFESIHNSQREEIYGNPNDINSVREVSASMATFVSEFGIFLDRNEEQLPNVLINVWDAQRKVLRRSTRKDGTTEIINPCVSLIGCTTPQWIKENFKTDILEGGLGSRILFIHESKKRHLRAYPHLCYNAEEEKKREANLIHDLKKVSELHGAMTLTPEAVKFGEEFYYAHNQSPEDEKLFKGYSTRKFVHMHKLAIIFSASEGDSLQIERRHLQRALSYLNTLERGLGELTANAQAGTALQGEKMLAVESILRGARTITMAKLQRSLLYRLNSKELDGAINDLLRAGKIDKIVKTGKSTFIWKDEGGQA